MAEKILTYREASKLCYGNESRLMNATQAGCYDCGSVFDTKAIKHWVDDKPQKTALCPVCGFDFVVANEFDGADFPALIHQLYIENHAESNSKPDDSKVSTSFSEVHRHWKQKQRKK